MTVTLRYSPPARRPVRDAVEPFAAFRTTHNSDGGFAWEHPAAVYMLIAMPPHVKRAWISIAPKTGYCIVLHNIRRGIRVLKLLPDTAFPTNRPPSLADPRTLLPFTGGLLFFIHGDLYAIQSETTVQVSRLSQPDGPGLLLGAYIPSALRI